MPGGPIDLTSPVLRGATFKEIGWLGPEAEHTQRLQFSSAEESDAESVRLDIVDDGFGPMANRISALSGKEVVFDATLDSPPSAATFPVRYRGISDGAPWDGELDTSSLLPKTLPGAAEATLVRVREAMRCLEKVQWLQANRVIPAEHGSTRPARLCSPSGGDLPVLLRRFPDAIELASRWLMQQDIGELRVVTDTDGTRFEIRPKSGWEALPIALAGEGVRALLPILLCACWAESYPGHHKAPGLLAIEEPECQLHPRLQVALAQRLVESVASGTPNRC